ncbi:MAG: phosphate ABC transporter permease PstA [Sphingomicrobium sp.]
MSKAPASAVLPATRWIDGSMTARVRKRYAAERRFKALGFAAVTLSVAFLAFLLVTMAAKGLGGFTRTEARLTIDFPRSDLMIDPAALKGPDAGQNVMSSDLEGALGQAATAQFGEGGADLFGGGSVDFLGDALVDDPTLLSKRAELWVPLSAKADSAAKHGGEPGLEKMLAKADTRRVFNTPFLTSSDATDPSAAGVWGALKGTFLTIMVTMLLAFPVGVLAALYLEEFAARNRWTDMIEVSINNLAAVPSIIFGLLGLAVFLNIMNLPRSAPLVGGLTLALMTMPVIVIAGRNAIKSVPPSIRDAALGVGASKMQVVFHHVLPLALPGILTGTIIGMARALGETAPLLMIGMRAFIASPPHGITDPATVLPVQIFLWSDEVDRAFVEKTSAAIIVLLLFMLMMNGLAIYLRNRFERRW